MKEISPYEFDFNSFYKFGKDWALIVVEDSKEDNVMTISWGQSGILWSRPIISVFVRNNRYTKHMMDNSSFFSVCFFDNKYKNELSLCGTKSKKEVDKIKACGFTRAKEDNVLYIQEANITFIVKKIYQVDLPINSETDSTILKHYKQNEYHTQYFGEIIKILINE